MTSARPASRTRHLAGLVVALLLGGTSAACSSDVDTGAGGGGGGDGAGCTCDEGMIETAPCVEGKAYCETTTCGDETIACIEPVPCDTSACVTDNVGSRGCATVGETCQTFDCHGSGGPSFTCSEDHVWTNDSLP